MIEYNIFRHAGDSLTYDDEVVLAASSSTTIGLLDGSRLGSELEKTRDLFKTLIETAGYEDIATPSHRFEFASEQAECQLPAGSEYMIMEIDGNTVESVRHGGVLAKIVMSGEMRSLPNGTFGLSEGDRIICATSNFYRKLTDEAILADALVSENCSEWMNFMIRRISDSCELKCGNLSAITLIVR